MAHSDIIDDITYGLSVRIIKGHCMRHDAGWKERKKKVDYTLWNIMEGDLYVSVDGREFHAEAGDVVLFYPGDKYTAWSDNGCQFVFVYFSLEMGHSLDLLSNVNLAGIIPKKYIGHKCIRFCRKFVKRYTIAQNATIELYSIFLNYLSDILTFTQREESIRFHSHTKNKPSTDMWDVIDYINEHLLEDLQIKQLAVLFNLSEKHFISKFKAIVGVSPGQYIAQCRMNKAAELVTDTKFKINEIARMLGYADQYSFSKAFKKSYGESPANFRKKAV